MQTSPRSHRRILFPLILLAAALLTFASSRVARAQAAANPANPPNPILADLLAKGVPFDNQNPRLLRSPTLPDGLNTAAQQNEIVKILALKPGAPINFAQFTAPGLNTPFVLITDDPAAGGANGTGHTIDLWFVVHGKLNKVADPKFLKAVFPPSPTDKIDRIPAADLKRLGIVPQQIAAGDEYYMHGQFNILGNVQIRATARVVQTMGKESSVIAGQIDGRFNNDPAFPNEWRPILPNPGGNGPAPLGNPNLYISAGGYMKITEFLPVRGALLVEYHLVYDEPTAWFNGVNLLRSRLSQKATDDVRAILRSALRAH